MLPYNEQIGRLYSRCTELRKIFIAVERQAAVVQEISLNASVSAGHLGGSSAACAEIAQQLSATGRRMRRQVESMRGEVGEITGQVLAMLIQAGRLDKYRDAQRTVVGSANQSVVRSVADSLVERIGAMAVALQTHVHRAAAMLRLVARCHQRLFIAMSALEIEAVELDAGSSQLVMALVERLSQVSDDGAADVDRAARLLESIRTLVFHVQETTDKELARAQIRAA